MKIDLLLKRLQRKQKVQKKAAIGLDIGRQTIKLVELIRADQGIKLGRIDSVQIEPTASAEMASDDLIKTAILKILDENQVKTKEVVLGVKGQSVFMKFLDILPVEETRLEKTIKYEARQQIPFALEEVAWDTHLFKKEKPDELSSQHLFLVAIKKEWLREKTSLAEKIGLKPLVFDVSNVSTYNCVRFNQDNEPDKLSVILDIGAQSTDLIIVKGSGLWMRSFAFGGDSITNALKKQTNSSFNEAEKLKHKIGVDDPGLGAAFQPLLEDLQGEISRSLGYYYSQQKPALGPPNRVDAILLSGAGSQLNGLDKFLAQGFSCPVRYLDPFKMLMVDDQAKLKLASQNKALFNQAVGLALRGLEESVIQINLLKEHLAAQTLSRQKVLYGAGSVILSLAILFNASTFMRHDYREKSSRLQKLRGLANTFSVYQPKIQLLKQRQELVSQQVRALSTLAANRSLWLEAAWELQQMLPNDLWITELSGSNSFNLSDASLEAKMALQGKAASYDGVNNFISQLKSSASFTEVKPISSAFVEESATDKEKVEVVKFSITMKAAPKKY